MTRLEILISFSKYLHGIARPARLASSDMHYVLIIYAREYIRRQLRRSSDNFEIDLKKDLYYDVHHRGNGILVYLSKEKIQGGLELKQELADRVLNNKVIEKPLLKKYKAFFKGSKLTKTTVDYYNHAVVLNAVVQGFLQSLIAGNVPKEHVVVFDLSTSQVSEQWRAVPMRELANRYIMEELAAVGMEIRQGICMNQSDVEYFHFSTIWGSSFEFINPRTGLLPYLTRETLNPLQSLYHAR